MWDCYKTISVWYSKPIVDKHPPFTLNKKFDTHTQKKMFLFQRKDRCFPDLAGTSSWVNLCLFLWQKTGNAKRDSCKITLVQRRSLQESLKPERPWMNLRPLFLFCVSLCKVSPSPAPKQLIPSCEKNLLLYNSVISSVNGEKMKGNCSRKDCERNIDAAPFKFWI